MLVENSLLAWASGLVVLLPMVAGYLVYLLKFRRLIHMTANIQSAPSWPLLGHAPYFICREPHMMPLILKDMFDTYGNTLKVWLGPELNICFSDAKDVEAVLGSTHFNDKASHYNALKPWLREGLLLSKGRKWYQRRKVLTPAFHFRILEQFVDVFERESRMLVLNLEREARMQGARGVELHKWISLCTLDSICETAMGVPLNAQTHVNSDYVQAVKTISGVIHKRMFDLVCRHELTYRFTRLWRAEKKALKVLHEFSENVIAQRHAELSKKVAQPTEVQGPRKRMAFLDILLQSEIDGKPLSDLDIREEVDTFMFEGHDTSASAILFLFYLLAENPACQEKCVREILAVCGSGEEAKVNYEKLNELTYLELCIKESLRIYPSVPFIGRLVEQDCEINGKTIPAGTNIGISPIHLSRNEQNFPEPMRFIPERFEAATSSDTLKPYAYIPFSAGPRNCIGRKFAMLEIKTVAVNVLRNFQLEYLGDHAQEPVLLCDLIVRPRDEMLFRLTKRIL